MLVGLSGTLVMLSLASMAGPAVRAFCSIMLVDRIDQSTFATLQGKQWCETLLRQWGPRLASLSENPSSEVRESVVNAIRLWTEFDLPRGE